MLSVRATLRAGLLPNLGRVGTQVTSLAYTPVHRGQPRVQGPPTERQGPRTLAAEAWSGTLTTLEKS